jgi:hypothetical protein
MSPRKSGNSGPFPYPTQAEWASDLYAAITATCEIEGVIAAPKTAIMQALAPALGAGEAKRVIERRRDGTRLLRPSAYDVRKSENGQKILLLNVGLHGAASLPWALNDRTRSLWLPPTAENIARLKKAVEQEVATIAAKAALQRAKDDQRRLAATATPAEKAASAAAVASATQAVGDANAALEQCQAALGKLQPLPTVRTAIEEGKPVAALTTAPASTAIARSVQRYTIEQLRARGRARSYDLLESMVQEGQLADTIVVLQATPLIGDDGATTDVWRLYQVTGNNRADVRLQIYGLDAADLLTGVPQHRLTVGEESSNPRLLVTGLGEILRRLSSRLNDDYADEHLDEESPAARAWRIAQVGARVVIGAARPERLEVALREINVHDHLRGQLVYENIDRSLGLFSTLVQAYQDQGLLGALLAEEITAGRASAADLDTEGIADALVGAGPLDPLIPLLQPGDPATPLAQRDLAIRAMTAIVFPRIPQPNAVLAPYERMPVGRYWPVVRRALQESAWSQDSVTRIRQRTEVWAAAVRQLFAYRENLLSVNGLFTTQHVKYGIRIDGRSLPALMAACRAGDKDAWTTLVRQHLLPGLVNAPEPFITPGQGSERSADRKGVRRTPLNALGALVNAYTNPAPGVTRDLLIAFAEAVLAAPDQPAGVGGHAAGTFWAPGSDGKPRDGVLADKEWYDTAFPKTGPEPIGGTTSSKSTGEGDDESGEDPAIIELPEDPPEDPFARMTRLRTEIPGKIESCRQLAQALDEQLAELLNLTEEAVIARQDASADELPMEAQKAFVNEIKALKSSANTSFDKASAAVMGL